MQNPTNIQKIKNTSGMNTYVVKYIGKMDEVNYVIVKANAHKKDNLQVETTFLHNTKVAGSAWNEKKALSKRRDSNHPRGRAISLMEMQQLMLSYPEVHTDLVFEVISTHPLEYRAGVERTPKKKDDNVQPGIIIGNISDYVRKDKKLPDWRQHSDSDLLMSQGIFESPISIDKITKFSLRPLELRSLIDQVGNYYRCFFHGKKTFNEVEMRSKIHYHVQKTMWIDGLRKQIKFRRNDIHELMVYLREIEIPKSNRHASHIMFNVFEKIERLNKVAMSNGDFMNQRDHDDWNFISSEIIYDDKKMKLPIPVYSYIKPHMGTNFLLHILLSLGHFQTELDLILHQNIKESFRYAKHIGKAMKNNHW